MPIRKEQFFPGALYHIYNRGNAKGEIFYTDKDRYRFLQGLYISNNSNSNFGLTHLEGNSSGCTLLEIKEIFDKSKISYDPLIKIYIDCLMPNHFHLFAEEVKEGGIVRFMQRSGVSYGRYFTIKNDRPGSLFQGRFKAVPIETDDQLKYLLAYINVINPIFNRRSHSHRLNRHMCLLLELVLCLILFVHFVYLLSQYSP